MFLFQISSYLKQNYLNFFFVYFIAKDNIPEHPGNDDDNKKDPINDFTEPLANTEHDITDIRDTPDNSGSNVAKQKQISDISSDEGKQRCTRILIDVYFFISVSNIILNETEFYSNTVADVSRYSHFFLYT